MFLSLEFITCLGYHILNLWSVVQYHQRFGYAFSCLIFLFLSKYVLTTRIYSYTDFHMSLRKIADFPVILLILRNRVKMICRNGLLLSLLHCVFDFYYLRILTYPYQLILELLGHIECSFSLLIFRVYVGSSLQKQLDDVLVNFRLLRLPHFNSLVKRCISCIWKRFMNRCASLQKNFYYLNFPFLYCRDQNRFRISSLIINLYYKFFTKPGYRSRIAFTHF